MFYLDEKLPTSLLSNILTVPTKGETSTPITETPEATCYDYMFDTTGN